MQYIIEYEVIPSENVPEGMARQQLIVISPMWRGLSLELEYPDGELRTLVGWSSSGGGRPAELRVFWTRHEPGAPAVCLAIGGDAGVRDLGQPGGEEFPQGKPFLALASSMVPAEVLEVIGPPPAEEMLLLI
ncbi:MAG: hypothetical protein QME75_06790 [Deltaproteobacteria bacterium]|nr:hypothetical protein [Deltaproteobacteria bacterium]